MNNLKFRLLVFWYKLIGKETYYKPGEDALWTYFSLSYASWITIPRVMMHEMPDEWQQKMANLLNEWDETWDFDKVSGNYDQTTVSLKKDGKYAKMPYWLKNYRHPDSYYINSMKRGQIK